MQAVALFGAQLQGGVFDQRARGRGQLELGVELAQQVEDLKRSAGSNSSANDLAALKREVSDQHREMDGLKRNVEDLSRKVK